MNLTGLIANLIRPPVRGHAEGPVGSLFDPPGGPSRVPIGTLKTLGGYVHQWDGSRWYNTGVRDAAAPRAQSAPDIEYDAQGRAWTWNGTNYQSAPNFDNPTKAAGYRAPAAAPAPRYPTTQINNQTGDIFTVDPYSGLPQWVGNDPRLVTDVTPGQQRANTTADAEAQRRYTTGENEATRRFNAGENAATRAASAEESGLTRALNAGQFAATLQAARARDEYTAEQDYQTRERQYGQDQIAGARTVAELTNSVDPIALPAFYRAGGGNIENAIQAGASAVSDRAVLPAAQALRGTREMARPTRYTFAPLALPPAPAAAGGRPPIVFPTVQAPGAGASVGPGQNGESPLTRPGTPQFAINGANQIAAGGGNPFAVSQPATPPVSAGDAGGGSWTPGTSGQSYLDRPGTPDFVKRYAFGTMGEPATGTFMTGDSTDPADPFAGGARPELNTVEDPPGPDNARVHVQPMAPPDDGGEGGGEMAKFGAVLKAIGAMLTGEPEVPPAPALSPPRYATGTGTLPAFDPFSPFLAPDDPYAREIRDIRTTTPYPELNPYSTKYRFEAPTVQQSFLMGRQGRYGVPVIDQQAQIARYQVPTARRGAFSLGV